MESSGYKDQYIRGQIEDFPLPYNLLDYLLNLHQSDLTSSSSTEQNNVTAVLTGDDAAHVDNLVYWGVDSPDLPPDIPAPLLGAVEAAPALRPTIPGPSTMSTTPRIPPLPINPASIGPTTPRADLPPSPLASGHSSSVTSSPTGSQPSTRGPSTPRPAKRARTARPGQSAFRLDTAVPSLDPSERLAQAKAKSGPHVLPNYSLCRCPFGPTKKPTRHWDVCPYNPAGRKKLFPCEICGREFTSKSNKDRHVKSCARKAF